MSGKEEKLCYDGIEYELIKNKYGIKVFYNEEYETALITNSGNKTAVTISADSNQNFGFLVIK